MSVGSMPRSRQLGFVSFMGVSTNTQGLKATRASSQNTLDQSVTSTSASRIESELEKSCSNHRSSAGTSA